MRRMSNSWCLRVNWLQTFQSIRNRTWGETHRGFESHPLRQVVLQHRLVVIHRNPPARQLTSQQKGVQSGEFRGFSQAQPAVPVHQTAISRRILPSFSPEGNGSALRTSSGTSMVRAMPEPRTFHRIAQRHFCRRPRRPTRHFRRIHPATRVFAVTREKKNRESQRFFLIY